MIVEMDILSTLSMFALLLIPIGIFIWLHLGLVRETVISAIRMAVQLLLVGIYLKYIFQLNNGIMNLIWVLIMMVAANLSVLGKSGLKRKIFFWRTLTGIAVSTFIVSAWFILVAIRPEPFYDARYMVPIIGMILGNCQRSNVMSLERFFSGIRANEQEFMTYLMLGASLHEAIRPYLRTSLKATVNPSISTMATMGIVSLPGMMTGQILGGALPMPAIKYQIGIMLCIFTAMVIAALINILLSLPAAFDDHQRLKPDIFQ
ncbi:ABC transporter permease [Pontiella agarivorans]|uniref:ABC transporter permease n=1 Tax=Pontiella agarivorans TaxID=3038953 RepID=A0ABU5N0F4_9BACT|nr:ABC transporter permease [Pontiella agarivorans]MDZ8119836.1 ABC transporter permease [Pontiella agarivorans]